MEFPEKYKVADHAVLGTEALKIAPIKYVERTAIMEWRNAQLDILRQEEPLTAEQQDDYFRNTIAPQFEQDEPEQLLYSYFYQGEHIGYGGLVHIEWNKRKAEISFLLKPDVGQEEFAIHWMNYLELVEDLAFDDLNLNKIYTYAFDLRPHLYPILEKSGFMLELRLPGEHDVNGKKVDALIHQKTKGDLSLRKVRGESDMMIIFKWANDPLVRAQSYYPETISLEKHEKWFRDIMENERALLFIGRRNDHDVGFVRVNDSDDGAVIGVLVDENHRGRGYASELIKMASRRWMRWYGTPIRAFIKVENRASVAAFVKAGYVKEDELDVKGAASYLYVLNPKK
jgi:RimJ/RimL family protein N-acetyltransferase